MRLLRTNRTLIAAVMALALAGSQPAGLGNPSGANIRFGSISLDQKGDLLRIVQSTDQGIIEWNTFSIARGQTTQFVQPGVNSATLNRVTGQVISTIDGQLLANGRVFLLNPNGVVIGQTGSIDVGSFTASTLDLSDENFLRGGDLTFRGDSQASVVNLGQISASHGDVFLVGAQVQNSGSITASQGTVGLAAGNDVLITESGNERVFVRGASGGSKEEGVINKGAIKANVAELKSFGGNIYGMAVKNEGRVSATAVSREGGQIFLRAGGGGGSRVRSTGSLTATRGEDGGAVTVDSGDEGATQIGGEVNAGGSSGVGGEVSLLGGSVEVFENSLILADGDSGGGVIRIGGGRSGEDPRYRNATNVSVGNGAIMDASARLDGDAGDVILFAEKDLVFFGRAEARGGAFSGDGGFVELSGKESVMFPGFVRSADVSAVAGENGSLLFDPDDVDVLAGSYMVEGPVAMPIAGSPVNTNVLYADDITTFLQTMGDLEIVTSGTSQPTETGIITLHDGVEIDWSSNSSLQFTATDQFVSQSDVSVTTTGTGSIGIMAGSSVLIGEVDGYSATFRTTSGKLTVKNGDNMNSGGVTLRDATLGSGAGDIEVTGYNAAGVGVDIGSADIQTGGGDLIINGYAGGGTFDGIRISTTAAFKTELAANNFGTVKLEGRGSGTGKSVAYNDPGMVGRGFFIQGDGSHDVEIKSLGGDAQLSDIQAIALSFESGMGVMAGLALTNSDLSSFSSASSNGIDVTNLGSLTIGNVNSSGPVSFTAGNRINVQGSVMSAVSIGITGHSEGYDWIELQTPLSAPVINLNGGTGMARVETHGTFDLNGVSLTNIDVVEGISYEVDNVLIDSSASSTIGLSTIYPEMEGEGMYELEMEVMEVEMNPSSPAGETVISISGHSGVEFLSYDEVSGGGGSDTFNIALDNGEDYDGRVLGGIGDDTFNIFEGGSVAKVDGEAGTDTISYSTFSAPVVVDLGAASSTQVALISGLENFVGGTGTDSLKGTAFADKFFLTGIGTGTVNYGSSAISAGFSGFESLSGEAGMDEFVMNGGSIGSIDGGADSDVLDYSMLNSQVAINVEAGSATDVGSFGGIEAVKGGTGTTDSVTATSGADVFSLTGLGAGTLTYGASPMSLAFSGFEDLRGEGGNDAFILNGGGIASIDGGADVDVLDYSNLITPVLVDIGAGSGTGVGTFSRIESFKGGLGNTDEIKATSGADTFTVTGAGSGVLEYGAGPMTAGFSGFETLSGEAGNDTFNIFEGGSMAKVAGGGGTDTISYSTFSSPVSVDLGAASSTQVALISGLENFVGGTGTDSLKGTAFADKFFLTGIGTGTVNYGSSAISAGFSGFESLSGEAGMDEFVMNGGSIGSIDGGADSDVLDYSMLNSQVAINVEAGSATDVGSFGGIEAVKGGTGTTDSVTATSGADVFSLTGLGAGTLTYGASPMSLAFSGFEDLRGEGGNDAFILNGGGIASIDGGADVDVLDYSNLITPVLVDIGAGSGTGVGTFSRIESFKGGLGNTDEIKATSGADTFTVTGAGSGVLEYGAGPMTAGFSGFETLSGEAGNDTFALKPGGAIDVVDGGGNQDTLDFSAISTPVSVDFTTNSATNVGELRNMEVLVGGSANDSLTGTSGDDTFRILSDNGGFLNSGQFSSFEHLRGAGGADQFIFLNQATVGSVDGGFGFDLLQLDDRSLTGTNSYTIGTNTITRNPTYTFAGLEALTLLLGSGDDTVSTAGNGLIITINAGGGFDILDLSPAQFITPNPMTVGGSMIYVNGFEGPFDPNAPSGTVLQSVGSSPTVGNGPGGADNTGDPQLLGGIASSLGNAFSAITSQSVVLGVGGEEYELASPVSMDGSGALPPLLVASNLKRNLEPLAWAELAAAIGHSGTIILVLNDGPFSLDLGGVPPELLIPLLEAALKADAARELSAALELTLAIPVTSLDGAVSILTIPVPIGPDTLALLAELLGDDAYSELTSALDG